MKILDQLDDRSSSEEVTDPDPLRSLVAGQVARSVFPGGVIVGDLIGMTDDGRTPLVVYSGQNGTAAIRARAVVDIHADHIGARVALLFEGGDPTKPIVMGILREHGPSALAQRPGSLDVDADGQRMVVTAKTQLVFRCGKASITLTAAGKVLIQGAYVSLSSSGVSRIKGGSVQLN